MALWPGELDAVGPLAAQAEATERRHQLVEPLRGREFGNADPEVVDLPVLAGPAVMHRLRAVAVRVEQEPAVVIRPVLGAWSRRAVVAVAGFDADAPELVDVLARRRDKADVQPPGGRVLAICLR